MAFSYRSDGRFLRVEPITLDSLRRLLQSVGGVAMSDGMHLTLLEVDGGFELRARSGRFNQPRAAWAVAAEKSQKVRVFRSAQAAFGVCRRLGFDRVSVELLSDSPCRVGKGSDDEQSTGG